MSLLERLKKPNPDEAGSGASAKRPAAAAQPAAAPDEPQVLSRLASLRAQTTAADGVNSPDFRKQLQRRIMAALTFKDMRAKPADLRRKIEDLFQTIIIEDKVILSRAEQRRLFDELVADMLGLGPLEPFLQDESVTEIMVNGYKNVYLERKGRIERSEVAFEDNEHVARVIDRIISPLGRHVDESHPFEDARLADGSRVNVIVPPVALVGPCLTIRKFFKIPITVEKLVEFGTITPDAVLFLQAAVKARLNIVICGGASSGKTTLLNVLSAYIPSDERIVTMETSAELQLRQEHVVGLEARPANIEGRGRVSIQSLVVNALRMRPDRIVVGEIRDEAALDMLQAMNTGHDGSMTTCHANSAHDALARLETMTLMAGMDLPVRAIREQVSSAIHLVCHMSRLRDGTRKVMQISEVQGMEGDVITTMDVFLYEQTGIENGYVVGRLRPSGMVPNCIEIIEAAGIDLPPAIFGAADLKTAYHPAAAAGGTEAAPPAPDRPVPMPEPERRETPPPPEPDSGSLAARLRARESGGGPGG